MNDLSTQIRLRAQQAQRSLAEARAAGDHYLAEVRLGELDSLTRIAADHSIRLDDPEESLAI